MASDYSPLKIELIKTGEQVATWGQTTNTNLGTAIEQAIGGKADITMSSTTETLSLTDTNAAQDARALYLNLTGAPGGDATLNVPAVQKAYIVRNGTTGGNVVTVKVTGQTGVSVPNGATMHLYNNGTDVVNAMTNLPAGATINGSPIGTGGGSVTSVTGTGTVNGITLTGNVTTSGSLTLGGALTNVDLASQVTNTLPTNRGGTGQTVAKYCNLTNATNVDGILPVENGGTGASTLTANAALIGNGNSAVLGLSPGTSGNVMTSNGSTWTSTAPTNTFSTLVVGSQTNKATISYTTNAARTITIPSVSGNRTFAFIDEAQTFTGSQKVQAASTQDAVVIAGRAGGTSSYAVTVTPTTLSANRTTTLPDSDTIVPIASQQLTFTGPSAARTITLPNANFTVARTDSSQTFAGVQTFSLILSANAINATSLTVNSNNISAVNSLSFRNRIINGNMLIDQRNGGNPVAVTTGTAPYVADRWILGCSTGTRTTQLSSTTPTGEGFNYSLLVTNGTGASPSSGVANFLAQNIEGVNVVDLAFGTASAKSVTISFWVRSSIAGTYSLRLANNDLRSYVATYTITSANTFEFKTITIPGDTIGTWNINDERGIQLLFDLGSGSNFVGTSGSWQSGNLTRTSGSVTWCATTGATFYLTGVQLEAGTVATPFERIAASNQLILCQRYYNILSPLVVNAGQFSDVVFPVGLRLTNPSITVDNGNISVQAASSRGAIFFSGITTSFTALVSAEVP